MAEPRTPTSAGPAAHDPVPVPEIRGLLTRLGRLRRRIRVLLASVAGARLLLASAAVLLAWFLADWLLDLPMGVRRFVRLGLLDSAGELPAGLWAPALCVSGFLALALGRSRRPGAGLFAFLTAGAVGLLLWVGLRALGPLAASFSPEDLALGVESRFGQLKDRLAGALDFAAELRAPSRGESPALMAAVVQEALDETRALSFSSAASARPAARWLLAGGGAAALCAAVFLALPAEAGLWARRSLLLEAVSWPRRTAMVAVEPGPAGERVRDPAEPYAVPLGRALTVYARAQGRVPDEAWLLDLVKDQQPLPRRMYAVADAEGLFAFEFRDVRRPFAFALQGGDDDDAEPVYQVEITVPPAVVAIGARVTYPAYLARAPREVTGGNLLVPEGSTVAVRFEASEPLAEAQVALGDATVAARPAAAGPPGRAFEFEFEAAKTLFYRLLLRTPDGKANDAAADTFEVRVEPDLPPTLEWVHPRASVERTPQGRVPLLLAARDDHGVAEVAIDLRRSGGEPRRYRLAPHATDAEPGPGGVPTAALDGPAGRSEVRAYVPLDLAGLLADGVLGAGDDSQVSVRAVARDARGQVRESDWIPIDVRAPARVERSLADRRADLRAALEAVRREQAQRLAEVDGLLDETLGRAEVDLLKTVRYAQGKIAQDLDRTMRDLAEVFNGFVYSRITAPAPTAHVLAFFDRHHRTTYGAPAGPPGGDGEAWQGDPVFPYALYDEVVMAWREKVIYDTLLLDRMLRLLSDGVGLAARTAPSAQRLAVTATQGAPEALRALRAAQADVLETLDRVLRAMQGWQSLHDLTMTLRSLIETQEALYPRAPSDGPADGARPR